MVEQWLNDGRSVADEEFVYFVEIVDVVGCSCLYNYYFCYCGKSL